MTFRAYDPTLRNGKENARIDCWLKRVPDPIVDKWYDEAAHAGEDLDNYHVGASAGCCGTVIRINSERQALEIFTGWKSLGHSPEETRFVLTYEREISRSLTTQVTSEKRLAPFAPVKTGPTP